MSFKHGRSMHSSKSSLCVLGHRNRNSIDSIGECCLRQTPVNAERLGRNVNRNLTLNQFGKLPSPHGFRFGILPRQRTRYLARSEDQAAPFGDSQSSSRMSINLYHESEPSVIAITRYVSVETERCLVTKPCTPALRRLRLYNARFSLYGYGSGDARIGDWRCRVPRIALVRTPARPGVDRRLC